MSKKNLINRVSEQTGTSKTVVETIINQVFTTIGDELNEQGMFTLVGFGSWKVTERQERTGVNPRTGEKITIKAQKSVRFKAGQNLKDKVDG